MIFTEFYVSFFATRSSYFVPQSNTSIPIFNKTTINDGDGFDVSASNSFTAPISDLYWFHVTIGVPSGSFVDFRLIGNQQTMYFRRNHSAYSSGAGVTTQNSLVNMTAGNIVTLVTSYPLYGDNSTFTSFGGLSLGSLMDPLVAFAFYVTVTLSSYSCPKIPYNVTSVDTHKGWNSSTNDYVVPVSSVYVVSTTMTSKPKINDYQKLVVNNNMYVGLFYVSYSFNNAYDSNGGSVIVNLAQNDRLSVTLCNSGSYLSQLYDISLIGFRYTPKNIQPVAFCAVCVTGSSSLLDPINYSVLLNIGSGWNASAYKFLAPYDGVYYVYMSCITDSNTPNKIEMLLNGALATSFINNNTVSIGPAHDQRSYAFILRLVINDEIRFRQPAGYSFFANANRHMTVSIFRVHT